jgi:hypothetical protein
MDFSIQFNMSNYGSDTLCKYMTENRQELQFLSGVNVPICKTTISAAMEEQQNCLHLHPMAVWHILVQWPKQSKQINQSKYACL